MPRHNPANERIKREYLRYLKEAKGRDEATLDAAAKALVRFEESTGRRDFKRFHREQAVSFKKQLGDAHSARTRERLSKSTVLSTLRALKDFFLWLAQQPGYKSHIAYADADYFNLSERDTTIARARREKAVPSLEQAHHALGTMPTATVLQRRDRALFAFAMLTGARVSALASLKLAHVNEQEGYVDQDAREVDTKFGKTIRTYFMPIGGEALSIFESWLGELRQEHLWGPSDPLFPATRVGLSETGAFVPEGLARQGWASTQPIRDLFRRAFEAASLPYFNPHSLRDMLVRYAMSLDLSPEEMKAWSQNLGHTHVLTTFTSYGQVPIQRQGELIRKPMYSTGSTAILDREMREALQKLVALAACGR